MDAKRRAKPTLWHYLSLIMRNAGIYYDGDNQTEIDEIVGNIIDAAVKEANEEMEKRNKSETELIPLAPPTKGHPMDYKLYDELLEMGVEVLPAAVETDPFGPQDIDLPDTWTEDDDERYEAAISRHGNY